jgi:RNA polymerase sigma factor (sigma-70 family)
MSGWGAVATLGVMNSTSSAAVSKLERPPAPAGSGELGLLLLLASGGDEAAWATLVDRFTARIRAVARMHRVGHHDAEDVVQTTWLRLLEHLEHVRDPAAVGAWLHTTARRESLRVLRTGARERPADDQVFANRPSEAPDAAAGVEAAERREALKAALATLPDHQAKLLRLLVAEPAPSYNEISQALDMPVGSIGPTRQRGVERLRRDERLQSLMRAS